MTPAERKAISNARIFSWNKFLEDAYDRAIISEKWIAEHQHHERRNEFIQKLFELRSRIAECEYWIAFCSSMKDIDYAILQPGDTGTKYQVGVLPDSDDTLLPTEFADLCCPKLKEIDFSKKGIV